MGVSPFSLRSDSLLKVVRGFLEWENLLLFMWGLNGLWGVFSAAFFDINHLSLNRLLLSFLHEHNPLVLLLVLLFFPINLVHLFIWKNLLVFGSLDLEAGPLLKSEGVSPNTVFRHFLVHLILRESFARGFPVEINHGFVHRFHRKSLARGFPVEIIHGFVHRFHKKRVFQASVCFFVHWNFFWIVLH